MDRTKHLWSDYWFQSTPARGGRLDLPPFTVEAKCVSIHARAGRATDTLPTVANYARVSIHARAGRATVP